MPQDPPSYARPRNMIRSHFKLDPPLSSTTSSDETVEETLTSRKRT
jgi:hypothetical protein